MKRRTDEQGNLIPVPTLMEKNLLASTALDSKEYMASALGQLARVSAHLDGTDLYVRISEARDHIRKAISIMDQVPNQIQNLETDG